MSTDKNWIVTELSDSHLKHSPRWVKYCGIVGVCTKCSEPTSLLNPCCDGSVYFEGSSMSSADCWDQIEQDMNQYFERDYDQEGKDL